MQIVIEYLCRYLLIYLTQYFINNLTFPCYTRLLYKSGPNLNDPNFESVQRNDKLRKKILNTLYIDFHNV